MVHSLALLGNILAGTKLRHLKLTCVTHVTSASTFKAQETQARSLDVVLLLNWGGHWRSKNLSVSQISHNCIQESYS